MPNANRPSVKDRDAKIIAGILKHLQNVPAIVLAGVSYTPTTLVALFQSHIDAANAVDTFKGQWKNAVVAFRTLSKTVSNAVSGLRELVRQMFNNAPDALADFGFAPKKAPKRKPVTNVVATQKRRATRVARHTMGPKEKLSVKGSVTAAEIGASVAAEVAPEMNPSNGEQPAGGPPGATATAPAPTTGNGPTVSAPSGAAPQAPGNGSAPHGQ